MRMGEKGGDEDVRGKGVMRMWGEGGDGERG